NAVVAPPRNAVEDSAAKRPTVAPESTRRGEDAIRRLVPSTPTVVRSRTSVSPWLAGAAAGVILAALLLMKFYPSEGKLVVECDLSRGPVTLVLDDRPVPTPAARAGIPLRPGKHRLLAECEGAPAFQSEFEIKRGQTAILQIHFPAPTATATA